MKAYQLKITLKDTHPPIWRRIIIPAGLTFTQLSVVLNEVMDWDGSHLYSFEFQNRRLRIEEVAEDFPGFGGMDVLEAFFLSERKSKPVGQYDAYRQLSEGKGFGRVQGVSPKSRFDEADDFFDMDDFDMDQMLKDMAKMRKTLGKHLLQGAYEGDASLKMIFRDYRKDDLTALAKLHNLSGYTKFKKAELIEKFSNDSNYMEASEEEIGNAMALLEGGYAGCHDFDDIVIPKEVAEAYKKNCGGEWHRLRREALELSYYLNGAAELYGICPMEKALELYRKYTGKNVDEITMYGFCESIPENKKNYHYNGMELVHKFFDKEEKREALVELQQGKEFYMPTKKEVLTLGKDGYFPFDDSMRNLESFLNIFLGEVPGFAANLCRHIQYQIRTGAEISEIMEFLEENEILEEISDREAFRSFEQLLAKVWSRTRKMSDRGTLPKGLTRQERMRAEEGRFAKADVVPFPVDLNRKIYPNDPCPCGSGKKYKKCCGRNK